MRRFPVFLLALSLLSTVVGCSPTGGSGRLVDGDTCVEYTYSNVPAPTATTVVGVTVWPCPAPPSTTTTTTTSPSSVPSATITPPSTSSTQQVPPGGGSQLPPGLRAGPGLVGYLGKAEALIPLTFGEYSPPGTRWASDGTYLEVVGDGAVLDHYRIPYEVVIRAKDVTIAHSEILTGSGTIYGIHGDTDSSGVLTVRDTTIRRTAAKAGDVSSGLTTAGATLRAYRCDISGTSDAVQPNIYDGTVLSQLFIHDLALVDPEAHLDGVQPFQVGTGTGTRALTIEHSWIDPVGSGNTRIVTPNSAITLGQNEPNKFEQANPVMIRNNYLAGGSYHLRLLHNIANVSVVDNTFGPKVAFGTHVVENPAAISQWERNTTTSGNTVSM